MPAMLSVFSALEGFTSDLYPYRYVVTPLLVFAGVVLAFVAVRLGVHQVLWRHRLATVIVGTPLLIVSLVAGDYLFSPLWERSFLEEASPIEAAGGQSAPATSGQSANAAPANTSMEARITQRGSFRGADEFHFGRGDAQIILTASGSYVLRFENFSVRNGPDLYVYLSRDETGRRVEEALNLGRLRATDGAFNYELPSNIDLESIKSIVVWCRQFTTLFAHAPLMAN
jgi:hypothetical protein